MNPFFSGRFFAGTISTAKLLGANVAKANALLLTFKNSRRLWFNFILEKKKRRFLAALEFKSN